MEAVRARQEPVRLDSVADAALVLGAAHGAPAGHSCMLVLLQDNVDLEADPRGQNGHDRHRHGQIRASYVDRVLREEVQVHQVQHAHQRQAGGEEQGESHGVVFL